MTDVLFKKIEELLTKIKSYEGKLLTINKRLKALEEKEPCFESEGGFIPNEKFMGWYLGSFADSEDDKEEVEEEEVIEEVEEVPEETVEGSEEILEKIDEVIENG